MIVFRQVASFDNFMIANMTLGLLEENGINCHLKDENIVTIDPLLSPAVGGIKLMVAEVQEERAKAIIKEAEADYIQQLPCPYCSVHALTVEEKVNNPEGFWGKLKNQVAYGQTATYVKLYRCDACKQVFNELPATF